MLMILLPSLVSAIDKPIDIETRKARYPWIWSVPRKQSPPSVKQPGWPRDDIDRFILSALERENLSPSRDASRETFIRRISFALIGLPPTPEQVDAFVNNTSPNAREKLIDRLLASPHFGERWARHWMDLIRYAESRGHESDFIIANAWHYRDYLIRAFNNDVAYDRILTEHLAGDILRSPRLHPEHGWNESVLATGWAFLGEEVHSPVDIRQDECDRIDNKIDVLSKTFMGLTVACARCHDHKFDAITQKDYYALSGFISSSSYRQARFETMEHNRGLARKLDKLVDRHRADVLQKWLDRLAPRLETWTLPQNKEVPAEPMNVIVDYSRPDAPWLSDGPGFGLRPIQPGRLIPGPTPGSPARLPTRGAAMKDPFWDGLKLARGNEKDSGSLNAVARSGRMIRTPTFTLESGRLHYLIKGKAQVYAAVDSHIMITGPLHKAL
ncbi:MAG: DUF1549 domain-containing protein, partial [Verrucomicrobiota bacterium]